MAKMRRVLGYVVAGLLAIGGLNALAAIDALASHGAQVVPVPHVAGTQATTATTARQPATDGTVIAIRTVSR